MRLIKGHILRKIHKNTVLVPPPDKSIGFNGMIVLNHTGEFICRMLCEETDRESLLAQLAQEYSVEPDEIEADLDAFLSELESCNMLEK